MGLKDRPYWRQEQQGGPGGGFMGGVTLGMPKPASAVKYLLIVNIAAFVAQLLFWAGLRIDLSDFFGMTAAGWWQLWRYVTFQFLHSSDSLWHLGLNMLGLYMLGTPLEKSWGTKRFLRFYLTCGVVAGLAYVIMAFALSLPRDIPLIGASGGVYAIVLACAILFPHFRLILFLFPVPIRLAAVIIVGGMILIVLNSLASGRVGPLFWSHVAHLGGAVAAAFWIWALPVFRGKAIRARAKLNAGAWERKIRKRQAEQEEIDRILEKIQRNGLGSLSNKERQKLRDATRKQRQQEHDLYRL